MKIKKEMALVLALAALTGGCAKQADDGKITLKVGNWPDETNAEGRDCVCGEYKNDEKGRYFEAKNVTGTLLFSMPVKKNGNGRKEQQ